MLPSYWGYMGTQWGQKESNMGCEVTIDRGFCGEYKNTTFADGQKKSVS